MAACLVPAGLQVDGCDMRLGVLQGACLIPRGSPSELRTCSACRAPFNRKKTQWVSLSGLPARKIPSGGYPEAEPGTYSLDLVPLCVRQVLDAS